MTPTTASTDQSLKTKDYPIGALIFAEYNPRQLTKDQYKGLRDSIERFGLVDPIIVNKHKDRKNIVVGGHQRIRIAQDLGFKKIPCVEVELDADREKELNIRLNKNVGEWDYDALANHFDVGELTEWGFTDDELQFYVDEPTEGLIDDDEVPEVEEAITKQGDLWLLGEHRLLCGDATKKEDVERLMDGQKADMVFTDPPYGFNYVKKSDGSSIQNDGSEFEQIIEKALLNIDIDTAYVCGDAKTAGAFLRATSSFGEPKNCIVWIKPIQHRMHRYEPCHEFIWYWGDNGSPFYGANVFEAKREIKKFHPTIKPIELIEYCLGSHSDKKSVLDLFLGSGSALIACEKTKRKCYGMEIDPHYCDVIVKRWEDFTGNKAERFEAASA
jgi:DNA modification methylase